jgi:predicted transcriptional regulator
MNRRAVDYTEAMEIPLTAEQEALIVRVANETGRDARQVVQDLLCRLVEDEAHFVEAVKRGFASLARGELMEHEEVGARLDRLFEA